MRRVTTAATLGFHRHMFEDKWSLFIGVALVADRVPARQRPDLAHGSGAVDVVTVVTLNQPFIDTVVVRLSKIRFGGNVAAVTKLRLTGNQQMLFFLGMVRRMTVDTTNITAGVRRLGEARLTMALAMTA